MTFPRLRSAGTRLIILTLTSISFRALEMVVLWTCDLFGNLLRSSSFIWLSVNKQFSLMIPSRQVFMPSSIFTWFRPPRGL